jgi:hypothetical protein
MTITKEKFKEYMHSRVKEIRQDLRNGRYGHEEASARLGELFIAYMDLFEEVGTLEKDSRQS